MKTKICSECGSEVEEDEADELHRRIDEQNAECFRKIYEMQAAGMPVDDRGHPINDPEAWAKYDAKKANER
jgi:hypothetical protein